MFLPTNIEEMKKLGWKSLDVLLVSGDAYVDHPSFGAAIIGKFLLANGFRVGILPQPDVKSNEDFKILPRPELFVGITSGNVDSMICNYTANRKPRRDDSYSEGGLAGKRPDRALIAYANKIKENYKGIPIVLGGLEASLRRVPHYDYWSDKIRNSIIFDTKADLLVYGQGEKAILQIAKRLQNGEKAEELSDIKNTAYILKKRDVLPQNFKKYVTLPDYSAVAGSKDSFAAMEKIIHSEINPYQEICFIQQIDQRKLIVNPPQLPVSEKEMDSYFDCDFERKPHPMYKKSIPAFDMIKDSVSIHRGCFGGCSFCAIGLHQGKFVQSRSEKSIMKEVGDIKGKTLTDLGGPSANMYKMGGKDKSICKECKRLSCLFPNVCSNLDTNHQTLMNLYKKVEKEKRFFVNSGIRHDLAIEDKKYIKVIAEKYTSGILKVAPEHTVPGVLELMYKPNIFKYERFTELFRQYSKKDQHVLPYLISSFPGCSIDDMTVMMNYLKKKGIKIEQVQDFLPSPMAIASSEYYTEQNIFTGEKIYVSKGARERALHRAMMQFFKPENKKTIEIYLNEGNIVLPPKKKLNRNSESNSSKKKSKKK